MSNSSKSDTGPRHPYRDDPESRGQYPPYAGYWQPTLPASQSQPPTYEWATQGHTITDSQDLTRYPSQFSQGHRLSRPASNPPRLEKPIAIPATVAKYGSPFLRAYPPCLASYSIPPNTFLSFLDTLNRVAVKSPPLQVLSLAGNIVGFVPIGAAQITGTVVSVAADVATGVLQHGRTEAELKRANGEIFGPRGLKVEIARTDALAKLARIPDVLDAQGKLSKNARLLVPLGHGEENLDVSGQQRRLDAMRPWIADLEMAALPEIEVPTSMLGRLDMKISERSRVRGEERLLKKRREAIEDHHKDSSKAQKGIEKDSAKLERKLDKKLRKIEEKAASGAKQKDLVKLDEKREKILTKYDRKEAKVNRRHEEDMAEVEEDMLSDDEEEKALRKLYWLIIRPIDAPSGEGENPDLPA